MHFLSTEGRNEPSDDDYDEHEANYISLEDYGTSPSVTVLAYEGTNVNNPALTDEQQQRLVEMLKSHESIMISSDNALSPPAYGVVCDNDVNNHDPIKQPARRIQLKYLQKLYELLKALLKAGPIAFSDSPWSSPIVIVLKKNGQDILLDIDYKMVNTVTIIMEYVMPLVVDLLTELVSYLRFCSLGAASGFWAILMTMRARKVSAFVCALGHFECLCMSFGLKNASMIYQRMIDNALRGFAQPKGEWNHFTERMQEAETEAIYQRSNNSSNWKLTNSRTKFHADRESTLGLDPVLQLVYDPAADMFTTNEPDESTLIPVFQRRSFVDDICFGGATFDDCLNTLNELLSRFEECRISVSFAKSIFCQWKVDFLSHEISLKGIKADAEKMAAITELSFPKTKRGMQQFLGALNYYSRFFKPLQSSERRCISSKTNISKQKRKVTEAPILRHFDDKKEVHVMLYANERALSVTIMQMHDDKLHPVRFCGSVLKDAEMNYHSAEKEVLALLLLLKVCYTQLAGKTLHVYTRYSTLAWVHKSKSLFGRAVQFAVLLLKLLQSTITKFVDLNESLALVASPTKGSPSTRMDPSLLYAQLPHDYDGLVVSFDGSAKTETNGGYRSCSWIVWKLPEGHIVIAASAYLEVTTVNMAEYNGMNNGVLADLEHGAEHLVIVGNPAITRGDRMLEDSLVALLNRHRELTAKLKSVRYLHVVCEYNAAADSLAGEALESKVAKVVLNDHRKAELKELNRIQEMIYESSSKKTRVSLNISSKLRKEQQDKFFVSVQSGDIILQSKTFTNFVPRIAAMTRSQVRKKSKRVHFEDELEDSAVEVETEAEALTDNAQAEAQHSPNTDDIDPYKKNDTGGFQKHKMKNRDDQCSGHPEG
ncbi:LOW QUALITY PROTEIN: hypothetical protein PHMEG_00027242 [Phytophthora megakarya]|uniref:Reverse transcriptase RNase H-like domain-containing protein n=1 Tax=Phytophthora megakarya TaxID=4795 RepID=A0A225V7B9_9STRA|nr:LOW QUALITY PROTEIN: hypothetical protein PHMEG_00027242 [Phytophthora megakarya]